MIIDYYSVKGCTYENNNGSPVLLAPDGVKAETLKECRFGRRLSDGRMIHCLNQDELWYIQYCGGAGCCRGIPYDGIGCVTCTGELATDGAVFPMQLTETIVFFPIFCFGMFCYHRRKKYAAPLVFMLSAVMKFLLEYLRESHIGQTISLTQTLCGICVLIGCVWLCVVRRKSNGTARTS